MFSDHESDQSEKINAKSSGNATSTGNAKFTGNATYTGNVTSTGNVTAPNNATSKGTVTWLYCGVESLNQRVLPLPVLPIQTWIIKRF